MIAAPGRGRPGYRLRAPVPAPPYRYTEQAPSPAPGRLILSYWSFQADAPPPDEPYTVFPDGCASVACVRTGSGGTFLALIGPRVTPLRPPFGSGTRIWGLRLRPDAIRSVLGVTPASIRDHFGPLPRVAFDRVVTLPDELPPSDDPSVVYPAMDRWAGRLLAGAPDPDPRVRCAVRQIALRRGQCAMSDVARAASVGLRHLQRLFPEATGLTLREYARVRRLREALAMRLAPGTPHWSQIAAGTGFVDHAHLTREFVALAGIAPSVADRQLQGTAHRHVRP